MKCRFLVGMVILSTAAMGAFGLTATLKSVEIDLAVRTDGKADFRESIDWEASDGQMHGFYFEGAAVQPVFNMDQCHADLAGNVRVGLDIRDLGGGKYDVVLAKGRGFSGSAMYFLTYEGDLAGAGNIGWTKSDRFGELFYFDWAPEEWDQSLDHRTIRVILPIEVSGQTVAQDVLAKAGFRTEPYVNQENSTDAFGSKASDGKYYLTIRFHQEKVDAEKSQRLQFYLNRVAMAAMTGLSESTSANVVSGENATDFFELVDNGTPQSIQDAIDKGADVNARDRDGRTSLMRAVMNDSAEVVAVLLKAGADVNAVDEEDGYTPLMHAVEEDTPEVITALLKAGANVNARDNDKETPLIIAARNNKNPEVTTALLKAGADVNAQDQDGWTALMLAADIYAIPDVIMALLNAGADVKVKNEKDEWTALDYAKLHEELKGTDAYRKLQKASLLAAGASPREIQTSDFCELVKRGTAQEVQEAIANGADVKARNKDGETALTCAAASNPNLAVITTLLNAGADPKAQDKGGMTALMSAAQSNPNLEVITTLLKAGADPKAKDREGRTVLMSAARSNPNLEVIAAILKAGADVRAQDKDGMTPLMCAAQNNPNPEVIKMLLDAGADLKVREKRKGQTPLILAAQNNPNPEVIETLLNAGAESQVRDKDGKTAFDYALDNEKLRRSDAYGQLQKAEEELAYFIEQVESGTSQSIQAALNGGADPNAQDEEGLPALLCAAGQSNPNLAVIATLLKAGADVNARDKDGGDALMIVADQPNLGLITTLLNAGANVKAQNKDGSTALMNAAAHNPNPKVITTLLKAGADAMTRDNDGKTAFVYAKGNTKLKGTDAFQQLQKAEEEFEHFIELARAGSPRSIQAALDGGADPNVQDKDGMTPLMCAVSSNPDLAVISTLLKAGAGVNAHDEDGWTPLMYAAHRYQNLEAISTLLKAGADAMVKDKDGKTAFDYAQNNVKLEGTDAYSRLQKASALEARVSTGDAQTNDFFELVKKGTPQEVQAAIENGADVNAQEEKDEQTPLMFAAESNPDPEVIATLLKVGADPNAQNKDGWTALMLVAGNNQNPEVITALLKAGADPNAQNKEGWTALMSAAQLNPNLAVLTTLLKAGADPKAQNESGQPALIAAAFNNSNPEVITTLLGAGADLGLHDRAGVTALMYAAARNSSPEVITALLKAGADVKAKDLSGETAFDLARESGNLKGTAAYRLLQKESMRASGASPQEVQTADFCELVKSGTLLEVQEAIAKGADVKALDRDGETPLDYAASFNQNPEVLTTLMNAGADPTAKDNDGWTVLMSAARNNPNLAVLTTLLKAGADPTAKDKNNNTPLTCAAQNNPNPEVLSTLLKAGADLRARIGDMTLVMLAANQNTPEVVTTLLKAGADAKARDANGSTAGDYARRNGKMKKTDAYRQLQKAEEELSSFIDLVKAGTPVSIQAAINKGEYPNAEDEDGSTALMCAASNNPNLAVLTTLLKAGADLKAQDKDGSTALMYAAKDNKNPKVIITLLTAGADAKMKDKDGKTALDYAKGNDKLKGTDALRQLEKASK